MKKKQKINFILLSIIVVLAGVLRFSKLGEIPSSLSWDEVSLGYNAYSILKTGRDEHNKFLPITTFEAYGDYKPPGYVYTTVPFVWLFGLNGFAVRFPSALFGTLTVLVTYFLVKELFFSFSPRVLALLASFFLAISPWHLNLSRTAFEANLALFFIIMGIWLLFKAINGKEKWLIVSGIFFVLSLYTFNSARIFVPLFTFFIFVFYRKRFFRIKKSVIMSGILATLLILPLIPHLFSEQGRLRFREVNIFSNLAPIEISNKRIAVDKNTWWARVIHNRRILFAREITRHYFDNLNLNFLFINGDGNPKFSIRDVGQLYLWDLPFLLSGFYFLIRKKQGHWFVPILWLFVGIVPASIARETPHALRIENTLPTWQIITAYGFLNLKSKVKSPKLQFKIKNYLFYFIVFFALFINFLYYYHNYYNNYPKEFASEWQWGYKQAIKDIAPLENKYDKVRITDSIGRPYMYVLFYKKYPPSKFWQEVKRTSDAFGFFTVHSFGKYEFGGYKDYQNKKALYVQKPKETPSNANIIKTIYYPNGKQALVIYD